jgi:hypothetical protein
MMPASGSIHAFMKFSHIHQTKPLPNKEKSQRLHHAVSSMILFPNIGGINRSFVPSRYIHCKFANDIMPKTRGQLAKEGNDAIAAGQQAGQNNPPPPPPAPQPAPQAQKPAPKKPKAATEKSGTKKATKPQKPKASARKGPAARQKDQEAYDPAGEEVANDENEEEPARAPKSGRKRPSPVADSEPSPKVARTQAAGRSGCKTPEAEPARQSEECDAVVENHGPSKAKGKGKSKGKKQEKEKADRPARDVCIIHCQRNCTY